MKDTTEDDLRDEIEDLKARILEQNDEISELRREIDDLAEDVADDDDDRRDAIRAIEDAGGSIAGDTSATDGTAAYWRAACFRWRSHAEAAEAAIASRPSASPTDAAIGPPPFRSDWERA